MNFLFVFLFYSIFLFTLTDYFLLGTIQRFQARWWWFFRWWWWWWTFRVKVGKIIIFFILFKFFVYTYRFFSFRDDSGSSGNSKNSRRGDDDSSDDDDDDGLLRVKVGEFLFIFYFIRIFLFILTNYFLLGTIQQFQARWRWFLRWWWWWRTSRGKGKWIYYLFFFILFDFFIYTYRFFSFRDDFGNSNDSRRDDDGSSDDDDGGLLGIKVGEFINFFLFYSIFLFILTDSFLLGTIPAIPGDMMMTSSRDKGKLVFCNFFMLFLTLLTILFLIQSNTQVTFLSYKK